MKKKFITLLLCAAVGIGALSGCGGNTSAKELPEDEKQKIFGIIAELAKEAASA